MSRVVQELKDTWRQFKADPPGERFRNHRQRMKLKSRGFLFAVITIGVVVLAAGIVFLFIPGPGTPLVLFGFALIAGQSRAVARAFDRGEPWLRRTGRRLRARFRRTSSASLRS